MNINKRYRLNQSLRQFFGQTLVATAMLLAVLSTSGAAQSTCGSPQPPPGLAYPVFDWQLSNSGTLPNTFAYPMEFDDLTMTVDSAASRGVILTPNQMRIEIMHGTSVSWKKEIAAWNQVTGKKILSVFTEGANIGPNIVGPNFMTITKGACPSAVDTIVFSKAEFLGVMVDRYHLDPTNFWRVLGGKVVTFSWNADNLNIGNFYPMPCASPCVPLRAPVRLHLDFDGDRRADHVNYRPAYAPATGKWLKINSQTNTFDSQVWGDPGDVPVAADYDGDGNFDRAVWRPSNGSWWVINSSTGVGDYAGSLGFGSAGDVPVPKDYDGDGKADLAIWRPGNSTGFPNLPFGGGRPGGGLTILPFGTWFIINSSNGALQSLQLGAPGDFPVPGDYDGDGKADIAVWNPSSGLWYAIFSSTNSLVSVQWGINGDVPAPADYDGDRKTDFAVYRPSNGFWLVVNSTTGTGIPAVSLGQAGDVPVPADYDGDGRADRAVWRPSNATRFIINSSTGTLVSRQFGMSGDIPVR